MVCYEVELHGEQIVCGAPCGQQACSQSYLNSYLIPLIATLIPYLNSYFSIFKESGLGAFPKDLSQIPYTPTGLPCLVCILQTHVQPAKLGLLE